MSSEVTGKQQKYIRIGPREFVPFEFDEITFDIVEACQKYFATQIDKDMVWNNLAGEHCNDQWYFVLVQSTDVRILPGLGSHVGMKAWMLFTGAVFIRIHRALRTRLLHGVRSKVRNRNSATDPASFWIKYRPYFSAVNICDRSSCHRIS